MSKFIQIGSSIFRKTDVMHMRYYGDDQYGIIRIVTRSEGETEMRFGNEAIAKNHVERCFEELNNPMNGD